MTTRESVLARLDAANRLDEQDGGPGGELYVEAMRAILPDAEALGDPGLLFRVRLSFTWAMRYRPLPDGEGDFFAEVLPLLRTCLLAWHADPHLFDPGDVTAMWNQLFLVVDAYIWLYPQPAPRIHRLLDELARHCPPDAGATRHAIDNYRMKTEARRGDVEAVERLWSRVRRHPVPTEHLRGEAAETWAVMWLRLGRPDRAVELLAPRMAGPHGDLRTDDLVVPFLREGRLAEAAAAHQRVYARPGMKVEDTAAHLEFCALTGNEERGLDVLHRNLGHVTGRVSSVEHTWTAAAAALLCQRVMARDLDRQWFWQCDCADPRCDFLAAWSYSALASRLYWEAVDRALRIDELNGTASLSERILALLHAEPVTDALPLPPDVSPPRHRATPPLCAHLPGAEADLVGGLADARALERRSARVVRLQRLLQSAVGARDDDAAHRVRVALLAELHAMNDDWRFDLFATLVELVRGHDAGTRVLDGEALDLVWRAVPRALDLALTLPTVHAAQIRGLVRAVERHHRPGTDDLHFLRWCELEFAVRCGDPAAARTAQAAFDALPHSPAHGTRAHTVRRARHLLDLGHADAAATLLTDTLLTEEPSAAPWLLTAHLRAGRLAQARAIHEDTWEAARDPGEVAAHLEFCARTGHLERGAALIQRHLPLFRVERDDAAGGIDVLRACAAASGVAERIASAGLDAVCGTPADEWTYAGFAASLRTGTALMAARWNSLLGSPALSALLAEIAADSAPP
ncbi:hypothetical protein GCM10022221_25610 [Actinocorallia aurea]